MPSSCCASPSRSHWCGALLCIAGTLALIGQSWQFAPEKLAGDAAGLITAMFFASYFLSVRVARRRFGAGLVTFLSTAITSLALLVVALVMEPVLLRIRFRARSPCWRWPW